VIEISDLYKYYGDRKAIGPLSFSIDAGEVVGLLGLNGAGKTTTLRILACDLLPSSGRVIVDGFDVVDDPHEVRARIGYLPDRPPLYDEMTVRAYLHFAARLRGLDGGAADRRVPETIEATQLQDVAGDPIGSLSHGFKQRVGIAQAIIHRPRLLVLDEPISGLDPVQIVEMRALLRGLKGEHTILLSSHILSEISETCDRILVIRDGEIGAQGTPDELSRSLLQGVRFEITLAHGAASGSTGAPGDAERALLREIEGVLSVEPLPSTESGDALSFRIEAGRDVRAEACAALVQKGLGILELRRSERELESVFLRLAAAGAHHADAPAPAKPRAKKGTGAKAGTSEGESET
jgi:ABC-2 type transport system ATP-binding protein